MWRSVTKRYKEGRLRAAFFSCMVLVGAALVLSGCGGGASVMRGTLQSLWPWQQDVSKQAATLPYASIDLSVAGRGGLVVLAELSHGNAYFQTSSRETIVLHNGYLNQTAGLLANLLMTRLRRNGQVLKQPPWRTVAAGGSVHYIVLRHWRDADGVLHAGRARATLTCSAQSKDKALPLATIALQRCREILTWSDGAQTVTTLWRDPGNHRLWAVRTTPWPGARTFAWQVARPWW